ncbi:MAG: pirin family protein [Phycisphaerales bacterium]|jgi:redox-sensitive bicupin YhaK (pirin superfamily)|nr:pirin family protein [Phycisphaerales bacterium]
MAKTKQISEVIQNDQPHWVGDGFRVYSLFSMQEFGRKLSPFLLFDYAAPTTYTPTDKPRGVDSHPHKGFETVTIVYQGGLEHRDSTGSSGTIGPGDVQWMTAGSGILHEEKHERQWSKKGGVMQMAQLWVNLPAENKSSPPGYQTILKDQIPTVTLADGGGTVRIIAGEYEGTKGPAKTFTPVNVYDMRLKAGHSTTLKLPEGYNTAMTVLDGAVKINGDTLVPSVAVAILDPAGEEVQIEATDRDAMLLILNGRPIDEPIAAYGPFVMNTTDEIKEAIEDFRAGKMGRLD